MRRLIGKIVSFLFFACILFLMYSSVDVVSTIKSNGHIHKYGDWNVNTPARSFRFGEKMRVCEVCGECQYSYVMLPTILYYIFILGGIIALAFLLRFLFKKHGFVRVFKPYYPENSLFFSVIHGGGVYAVVHELFSFDPLNSKDHRSKSLVLKNINTNETYFAKSVERKDTKKYIDLILHSMPVKEVLWPSDVIVNSLKQEKLSEIAVTQNYTDRAINLNGTSEAYVLFPNNGYSHMIDLEMWLQRLGKEANWKNNKIIQFIKNFLAIISDINHNGYLFFDYHFSRILLDSSDKIMINFSHLFFREESADESRKGFPNYTYPIETAEPATFLGHNDILDEQCQNYSLCAFLFYLMFNRWPYDGRLLDEYTDMSLQEHYTKFRQYQSMPVFIFDPEDDQNKLGMFHGEEKLISLWNDCPEQIKTEFTKILRKDNTTRPENYYSLSADEWLSIFSDSGLFYQNIK